jgi:hypothetical protein
VRSCPGDPTARLAEQVAPGRLAAALEGSALVEFVQLDEMLDAVTVVDGRIRWRTLGPLLPRAELEHAVTEFAEPQAEVGR